MNNDYVNFKKQRELGSILTDTFKFVRLEGKTLMGLLLKIAGPALLIVLLAYIYYMQVTMGSFDILAVGGSTEVFGTNVILAFFLMLISGVAFYALMYGTVLQYIKSYIKNDGNAIKEEVTAGVRQNFWSLLGISFLVGLISGIGFVFCVIPGIYFGTVLSTTYAIHVFENRDTTDSISYSFQLIKGEWWITFATYLVIFILYYIITIIFSLPGIIYSFINIFTVSQEATANPADMFDWVYVALNVLGMIGQYLLYALIIISTALVYFNLNERKNFTGTMETIETLGKRDDFNA
ncbi:hypothetical protein [Marixanthomonas ophiurae]|uniref:Glycerophosphoryl diester phosphodiesterase membrane domain-containing protein n=1 Tax=Marixanthomonas ophiurae TaxID=387659 RepID=A0A3E1Q7D2_9FLAO|nr:hypothetical protein [Marixanthomonas ophiurae]RFN58030.1 hypothetical protein DZ858_12370 [Marixanthomonas ophiurae]